MIKGLKVAVAKSEQAPLLIIKRTKDTICFFNRVLKKQDNR